MLLVFICIPVSPGYSRLIWAFPRNFGVWIDRLVPQWMFHLVPNLVIDSDLCLLRASVTLVSQSKVYFPCPELMIFLATFSIFLEWPMIHIREDDHILLVSSLFFLCFSIWIILLIYKIY